MEIPFHPYKTYVFNQRWIDRRQKLVMKIKNNSNGSAIVFNQRWIDIMKTLKIKAYHDNFKTKLSHPNTIKSKLFYISYSSVQKNIFNYNMFFKTIQFLHPIKRLDHFIADICLYLIDDAKFKHIWNCSRHNLYAGLYHLMCIMKQSSLKLRVVIAENITRQMQLRLKTCQLYMNTIMKKSILQFVIAADDMSCKKLYRPSQLIYVGFDTKFRWLSYTEIPTKCHFYIKSVMKRQAGKMSTNIQERIVQIHQQCRH
jgi:hypothetical protein